MMDLVIWGTGYQADKLAKLLLEQNSLSENATGERLWNVQFFVDSNPEKLGTTFLGKPVYLPEGHIILGKQPLILVAVLQNQEIISYLDEQGCRKGQDYLPLADIPTWLWQELCIAKTLCAALGIAATDFWNGLRENCAPEDTPKRLSALGQEIASVCLHKGHGEWSEPLHKMLLQTVLHAGCGWADKQAMGMEMQKLAGIACFADALESVYEHHTAAASEWMPPSPAHKAARALPRTVAMYYTRYYSGGTERVISKLLPMFQAHGYRMILFTDEIREELEYPLPEGVARVRLGFEGGRQARAERLLQALRDYQVDLFVSHSYTGNVLYDIFCVQQAGVPVVLELHNIFSFIADLLGGSARALCSRTDALVTLSKADQMFWRLQGCRSMYVPNPVEPPAEAQDLPVQVNTILWLQRIEQVQKQVLELPGIMLHVHELMPEARLLIVGRSDDNELEKELKDKFAELGLAENVEFLGFHTDVDMFYKQAPVMLITSAFEGFPLTVAESKRWGVPIVLYDLPYLELLQDGRGYIAVPQHDQRAAAEALVRILRDSELRAKMSCEARDSLKAFCKQDLMSAWDRVMALAMLPREPQPLDAQEKIFRDVENLLLGLAERAQAGNPLRPLAGT